MFPEAWEYSLAPYMDALVKWMVASWGPFFDTISNLVLSMLMQIEYVLKWMPWWGWILLVTFISWRLTKNLYKTLLPGILVFSIGVFGLWEVAMETLGIVVVAVLISLLFGIPLGIAMASYDRFNTLITPVLDAMQTMPSLVYLIPALMLFGLGKVPAVFATVVYALPPVMGLPTWVSVRYPWIYRRLPWRLGPRPGKCLKRVPASGHAQHPGWNQQTTMLALSMVVIASMIGAGGLGEEVLKATNRVAAGKALKPDGPLWCWL